tara:strand:+ start:215 stop:523 length:309 start_codon:yes stop_codon:yes gene_type:complete
MYKKVYIRGIRVYLYTSINKERATKMIYNANSSGIKELKNTILTMEKSFEIMARVILGYTDEQLIRFASAKVEQGNRKNRIGVLKALLKELTAEMEANTPSY